MYRATCGSQSFTTPLKREQVGAADIAVQLAAGGQQENTRSRCRLHDMTAVVP